MAMIKRKSVSSANSGSFLKNNNGTAKKLLIFSNIQFSILRRASSHMPAHAVDDTNESQTGTFDVVKFLSTRYNSNHPTKTISSVIVHSLRVDHDIFTSTLFCLVTKKSQP